MSSMLQSAVGGAGQATGGGTRRITREDIVRAGRARSPWEYVPLALAALRVMPADAEIRFLLVAAYVQLGLRTPALEQLHRLAAAHQSDPNVLALAGAARALPPDCLELKELERTVRGNTHALRSRAVDPFDLSGRIDEWRTRAATRDWFRAYTGDVVWRTRGEAETWERFEGQREMAAGLRLEHDPSPTARTYPPPYFVEGMDPPWVFERLCDATPRRPDGHASLVVVVQRDEWQFLDGLAHQDMTEKLADPRVRVFVGEDGGTRLEAFVLGRRRAGIRAAGPAITLPTTPARVSPTPEQTVAAALVMVRSQGERLGAQMARMYAGRDRAWWAGRFAGALSGSGEPLRVLIASTRYTTFLRHSVADLGDALSALGCRVRVHIEPDPHAIHDAPANMLAVVEHCPDLIVTPNYLRSHMGVSYPPGVPFLTWVQDSMAHLFENGAGALLDDTDFMMGNLREEMFQRFGYPRARALATPMAASARKFHPGHVPPEPARRHARELAYVSHHSATPEEMHRLQLDEVSGSPKERSILDALFPKVLAIVDGTVPRGPLVPRLREATRNALRRAGVADDGDGAAKLLNNYTLPIADRALRHKTLAWAVAIAARRGWCVHLYGRGWETHPTLSPMARRELGHGEDLRCCYQTARAHLHVSLHTAIHQRVFECAMSGGLPLCRLQADDLSQLEYLAAAHACRAGARPLARDSGRVASHGYRYEAYAIDSCAESRRYAAFARAMGLPAPEVVWLNGVHAERLRSSPSERIDGDGESLWDLWPDPGALMFHDEPTLERVLARAVEDDAWRSEQSQALGDRARQRVTYDALAKRMIEFVASGLAANNAGAKARWYDTPQGRSTGHAGRPITPP